MTETVDVSQLRVGMFVHLDVGWMSHPFPLSSFKIASAEQIQTIQGLGLKQLRWSPERSDPAPISLDVVAASTPADEEPRPIRPRSRAASARRAWKRSSTPCASASGSSAKPAATCAASMTG